LDKVVLQHDHQPQWQAGDIQPLKLHTHAEVKCVQCPPST